MTYVRNGQEIQAKWPEPRGKKLAQKTKDQMEWFRQAQLAAKVVSPDQMFAFEQATKGTPLLPRDMFTMMWAGRMMNFIMDDGRTIWSKQAVADVSTSLDTISQTVGDTLVRGPDGWGGVPAGGGGGSYSLIDEIKLTATTASLTFPGIIQDGRDLFVSCLARVNAANDGLIRCRLNGDAGNNYYTRGWHIYGAPYWGAIDCFMLGSTCTSAAPANTAAHSEVQFPYYAANTYNKGFDCVSNIISDLGGTFVDWILQGQWQNPAPITDIEIYTVGAQFEIGSTFTLYKRG